MKTFLTLLFSTILFQPAVARSQERAEPTGGLVGRVVEAGSEVPLPGASVVLARVGAAGGAPLGAATGDDGRFRIERIPVGTYTVRVTMVGYEPVVRTSVVVTSGPARQLNAVLRPAVVETDEVVVTADYFAQAPATPVSARSLYQEEVWRAPGAAEDIQRVMQAFPGVVFGDDHRNDLVVRGGSPTENLTRVDDIEIPNINHFGTQGATGGPISMLDTDFIDEVRFLTGGFPAEYGGRLSSVLDVRLREGNREQIAGSANLSMAGAGLSAEGPTPGAAPGRARGSWFVGGRRSYLDLLHGAIDLTAVPQYAGGQARVVYDLTPADQLAATVLAGWDDIHFERDADSDQAGTEDDVRSGGTALVGGLSWRRLWAQAGFTRLTLSAVSNTFRTDARDSADVRAYRNRSRETEFVARLSSSWNVSRRGTLGAGGALRLIDYRHDLFLRADEDALGNLRSGLDAAERARPGRADVYTRYTHQLGRLAVTGGLRYDYFSFADHAHTLSPRLSARYQFHPTLAFSGAWGVYRQTPALVWYTSTPTARALRPTRAVHYVAGAEWRPQPVWLVTLEAYVKRYDRIPVFASMPALSTLNEGTDYGALVVTSDLMDAGTARAAGIELFAQRRLTGRFYTTAAYALSRSRYTPLDGRERPTDHDMRHVASLVAGTAGVTVPRLGTIGGSFKLRYATGRPTTPIDLERSRRAGSAVLDAARVNTERLGDYVRLDVRLDRRTSFGWGAVTSYSELQNVLGRRNEAARIFNDRTGEVETYLHWGRFFVGGVLVEF